MMFQELFNAAKSKLTGSGVLGSAARRLRALPAKAWLAAAALICLGLWLQEHDASLRRAAELSGLKEQTAAQVRTLEARAAAALDQANRRNAAEIAELEAQRRNLAARGVTLAAELEQLKVKQQARAQEIAALPPAAVQEQLLKGLGARDSGLATRGLGLGTRGSEPEIENPKSEIRNRKSEIEDPKSPSPEPRAPSPFVLGESAQRAALQALAERDACREQSALQNLQFANCNQRADAGEAEIREQADSLAQLRQALDARAQIEAARQKQFEAELRAARGTRRTRLVRALKFLAVGAAIGAALR